MSEFKKNNKKEKILYSCLAGGYDDLPELNYQQEGWSYILFTDLKYETPTINGWEIKELKYVDPNSLVKTCRWHKLNSHLLFPDCLYSVYVDCNVILNSTYTFTRAEELYQKNILLASIKHPVRDCIYDEAEECKAIGKDTKLNINSVVDFLRKKEYPANNGLFESNLLFRNHTKAELEKFNEKWWELLNKYTRRDQLTMNYVLWKQNIDCDFFLKEVNTSVRNSEHYKFIENHKILNNIIEINLQEIVDKDIMIHEKNLELTYRQSLITQKEQENQYHINLYQKKEKENQYHIDLYQKKEKENQQNLSFAQQKEKENQLLSLKLKKIKNSISHKLFFKIEMFFREIFQ